MFGFERSSEMKSSAFAVVFLFVALVHVCQSRLVYETAFYDADSSSPKSIVNFDGQGAANPLEAREFRFHLLGEMDFNVFSNWKHCHQLSHLWRPVGYAGGGLRL